MPAQYNVTVYDHMQVIYRHSQPVQKDVCSFATGLLPLDSIAWGSAFSVVATITLCTNALSAL